MHAQLSLIVYDLIRLDMSPEQRSAKYFCQRPGGNYSDGVSSMVQPQLWYPEAKAIIDDT